MVSFKPGYQLHAQFLPFQSFANNGRWRCKWHVDEDKGVDDFLHDIEDNDNGYEDEVIICCRHSYKCMHIYYIQWKQLYMQNPIFMIFHRQVLFIQTIYKLDKGLFMHNCICVFTMMVLCRQKLRFPKHGRSQVKKILCFYIWYDHHMGFTSQWRIQGGGGQGGQDPPWDSQEEVPAHGKIAFICWKIVSKFAWLDLSPKDDQNRGEDTNISKIFLGRTPQNNQSQYNGFHNPILPQGGRT